MSEKKIETIRGKGKDKHKFCPEHYAPYNKNPKIMKCKYCDYEYFEGNRPLCGKETP